MGQLTWFKNRSFSFSKVLVAIIPGTQHPKPSIMGMNDFPCKPTSLCIILSMTKAALARYPLSSSTLSIRNNRKIMGKNTATPPTPPMIPSTMNDDKNPSPTLQIYFPLAMQSQRQLVPGRVHLQ